MIKHIHFILLFTLASLSGLAQGIQFEQGSWADVKAKAKKQNKPIFVDAYTTWCGPCKVMAKNVFTTEEAGEYFNTTYINYQMDMEKGEGIEFAKQWEVNAFPTLLYFDSEGKLAFKAVGAKDLPGLLSQAKLALNPQFQLETYRKEYEESGKTIADLTKFTRKLREGGSYSSAAKLVSDYILNMPAKDRFTEDVWKLYNTYIFDYKNPLFEFLLQNRKQYYKLAGEDKINAYIFNVIAIRSIPGSRGTDSRETYYGTLEKYRQYIPVDYFIARMLYFEHLTGDADSLYKYSKNLFEKEYKMIYDDDKLSYYRVFMANRYIDETGEKLESALRWAQKAASVDKNDYKPAFVLAQLLYKKGDYKGALKWAEKAKTALAEKPDAPVMQKLFKAETIDPFIQKVKDSL